MNNDRYFRPPFPFPPPPFPPPFADSSLSDPQFPLWPPTGHVPPWPTARQEMSSFPPPLITRSLLPVKMHGINLPEVGEPSQAWPNVHPAAPRRYDVAKTQDVLDREWIENFSHNRVKRAATAQEQKSIKISEARALHKRAHSLIEQLQKLHLQPLIDDKIERSKLKDELDKILSTLKDEKVLACLTDKLQKRRKKRRRTKQNRHNEFLQNKEREQRVKQKQEETDDWLRKCYEEQENQKREQQVQKDLDDYLKEVRQKQTDLKRSLQLVSALGKLRKARKQAAIQKGLAPPEELDKAFQSGQSSSREHLLACICTCEEEEKRLRSFLAEENRMEEEKIKKRKLEEEETKRTEWIENREMVLFGRQVDCNVSDPMWPMQQLHKHASSNLVALAQTRQQWDQFISDSGSRIPHVWVEPDEPSSEEWRTYLEQVPSEK